jgi:hypothetical protein
VQYNAGFAALQQFFSTFCFLPNPLLEQLVTISTTAGIGTRREYFRRVRCKIQPKT